MRPSQGLRALATSVVVLSLLVLSVTLGSRVPTTARLPDLAVASGVSFGPEPAHQLTGAAPSFVESELGVPAGALSRPETPAIAPPTAKKFECVNGHQTADPLSPPCDTSATTTNDGATYQGVSSDEIRVALVAFGNWTYSCGERDQACPTKGREAPYDVWFDLDQPQPETLMFARAAKDYAAYFNARFQTFGRRVHVYLYFFDSNAYYEKEASKGIAKRVIDVLHPFAAILQTPQFSNYLAEEFARRGVPAFTDLWDQPQPQSYYSRYPGRLFGFWPTIETNADLFSSYVCQKVVPNPVSMSGNPGENGRPRKLGLIYGLWHELPWPQQYAEAIAKQLHACGVEVEMGSYASPGCAPTDLRHTPTSEALLLSRFKARGVTTVLWPTCMSSTLALAAEGLDYFPEWIILGDYSIDSNGPISNGGMSPLFTEHSVVVTAATYEPPMHKKRCYQALTAVDPAIVDYDAFWACRDYERFRQLFSAIQLAGPSLGPASMSRGLASLPTVASPDALTPTCSYAENDMTCVKDAMVMYWDAHMPTTYNQSPAFVDTLLLRPHPNTEGCWRVLENGKRYLPWTWPAGNVYDARTPADRCNDHDNFAGGIDYTDLVPPDRYRITAGIPGLPETLP